MLHVVILTRNYIWHLKPTIITQVCSSGQYCLHGDTSLYDHQPLQHVHTRVSHIPLRHMKDGLYDTYILTIFSIFHITIFSFFIQPLRFWDLSLSACLITGLVHSKCNVHPNIGVKRIYGENYVLRNRPCVVVPIVEGPQSYHPENGCN